MVSWCPQILSVSQSRPAAPPGTSARPAAGRRGPPASRRPRWPRPKPRTRPRPSRPSMRRFPCALWGWAASIPRSGRGPGPMLRLALSPVDYPAGRTRPPYPRALAAWHSAQSRLSPARLFDSSTRSPPGGEMRCSFCEVRASITYFAVPVGAWSALARRSPSLHASFCLSALASDAPASAAASRRLHGSCVAQCVRGAASKTRQR